MHHGLAVAAYLDIDLNAVVRGNRGAHGASRVLDDAVGGVVQPAMGDRPRDEPIERGSALSGYFE